LTDGEITVKCGYLEVWRCRFVEQRNWKHGDLLMCIDWRFCWWT